MESENKKKFNPVPIIIIGIIGLIAIGLIIGGLILLTVLIIIPYANNKKSTSKKVLYDTKYVNEDGDIWVEFHKDGTCNRSVKGIISCKYERLKDEITITEVQTLFEEKVTMKYTFKINDNDNMTHVKTCSPIATVGSILYCGNEPSLKYKYSTKNTYIEPKEDNNKSNAVQTTDNQMMHIEDNYYYMCLVGNDRMIFTFKEDYSFSMIYQELKLTIHKADYKTTNRIDGKYSISGNTLHLNNALATITFGPSAGVKTQVFKYGGYDCTLVDGNQSTAKEEKKVETKEEKNNNENSNNFTTKEESDEYYLKSASKTLLDNSDIYFNDSSDHILYISVSRISLNDYTLTINGKKYNQSYNDFELTPGENCFNVEVSDKYGNKKSESKCYNFTPVPLNYSVWNGGLAPNGTCDMHLYNEDVNYRHTYNYDQLKCTFEGQEFDCADRDEFTANMGTSKITIKNRYGNTQEIEFTCSR